jgi:hypothetical protein
MVLFAERSDLTSQVTTAWKKSVKPAASIALVTCRLDPPVATAIGRPAAERTGRRRVGERQQAPPAACTPRAAPSAERRATRAGRTSGLGSVRNVEHHSHGLGVVRQGDVEVLFSCRRGLDVHMVQSLLLAEQLHDGGRGLARQRQQLLAGQRDAVLPAALLPRRPMVGHRVQHCAVQVKHQPCDAAASSGQRCQLQAAAAAAVQGGRVGNHWLAISGHGGITGCPLSGVCSRAALLHTPENLHLSDTKIHLWRRVGAAPLKCPTRPLQQVLRFINGAQRSVWRPSWSCAERAPPLLGHTCFLHVSHCGGGMLITCCTTIIRRRARR